MALYKYTISKLMVRQGILEYIITIQLLYSCPDGWQYNDAQTPLVKE